MSTIEPLVASARKFEFSLPSFDSLSEFFREDQADKRVFTDAETVEQFRAWRGLEDPESLEGMKQWIEWRSQEHQRVLVVGAGRAGEKAVKALIEKGYHPIVLEKDEVHGGMAAKAIDSIKHSNAQIATYRDGAVTFSDPRVDVLFGVDVQPDQAQEAARQLGCVGLIWTAGAHEHERKLPVDYDKRGVLPGMKFIDIGNRAAVNEEGFTMLEAAKSVGYRFNENGVPLPTIIQAGGRVGEDVAVKDKAMRLALALERKGVPDNIIAQLDFGKMMTKQGMQSVLEKLGLTPGDVGETIMLYRGDLGVMRLVTIDEKLIVSTLLERQVQGAKSADGEERIITAGEVEAELRSLEKNRTKVLGELADWEKELGITVKGRQLVTGLLDSDKDELILKIQTPDGERLQEAGLLVSAIGFEAAQVDIQGEIPAKVAGMAESGAGAIPISVKSSQKAVNELDELIKSHAYTEEITYTESLKRFFKLDKMYSSRFRDAVERMIVKGPRELLAEWWYPNEKVVYKQKSEKNASLDLATFSKEMHDLLLGGATQLFRDLLGEKWPDQIRLAVRPIVKKEYSYNKAGGWEFFELIDRGSFTEEKCLDIIVTEEGGFLHRPYTKATYTQVTSDEALMRTLKRVLTISGAVQANEKGMTLESFTGLQNSKRKEFYAEWLASKVLPLQISLSEKRELLLNMIENIRLEVDGLVSFKNNLLLTDQPAWILERNLLNAEKAVNTMVAVFTKRKTSKH